MSINAGNYMRKQCIITIERQLPVYRAVEVPKQGGGDYPAALPVTAPHPAPCGAAAPAVPAVTLVYYTPKYNIQKIAC